MRHSDVTHSSLFELEVAETYIDFVSEKYEEDINQAVIKYVCRS